MGKPLHIAVIDDDESIRESLSGLFRSLGHQVRLYASANQFLSDQAPGSFSCLLLDFQMPNMNGIELQQQLKDEGSTIPIIFISSREEEHIRNLALSRGAVAFLTKPLSEEVLLEALGALPGMARPSDSAPPGGTDERQSNEEIR